MNEDIKEWVGLFIFVGMWVFVIAFFAAVFLAVALTPFLLFAALINYLFF